MGHLRRRVGNTWRGIEHRLRILRHRVRRAVVVGWLLARALPRRRQRAMLWQAWRALRSLPTLVHEQSLPQTMALLDTNPLPPCPDLDEARLVTRLADVVVAFDRQHDVGPCLRRSLIRFHLLRRLGLPVTIHVGVQRDEKAGESGIVGHAWLTLDGRPWEEPSGEHHDHVVMFCYPPEEQVRS